MKSTKKLYAERDALELDIAGGYYGRHVHAMTAEQLHSKSDIAAELAYRDLVIDEQKHQIQMLLDERSKIGLAVSNAILNGDVPDVHPVKSRLEMLANIRGQVIGVLDGVIQTVIFSKDSKVLSKAKDLIGLLKGGKA